jgi:uncharacterized protein
MARARFRFYAELNDFLPVERRYVSFDYEFLDIATVKDRVESLGVPHTEVDLILANGESVDFAYRVQDGDCISVYPVFEAFDVAGVSRLRAEPLREPRFVLDVHLGRLARYLRMLGFDAWWRTGAADEELARVSKEEHRILLTRDVGLLKRGAITHGYWMRETEPRRQIEEVVSRFDLARRVMPFTRCLRCNVRLVRVTGLLHRCGGCGRVYWKGSHYERMQGWVDGLLSAHPVTAAQQAELERRLASLDPDRGGAVTWTALKAELERRRR